LSVDVTISAPIAGVIEGAAALKGTVPKNGYKPTTFSIGGFQIKIEGIGVGGDVYYDREKGLTLELDASLVAWGNYGDSAFN
jgi:hypothetical protein